MALSTQQLQALKTYIDAQPEWAALPNDSTNADIIAQGLNQVATPSFIVWRTSIPRDELRRAALGGASEMDNLEAGKRDALFWMLGDSVNPSLAATRQAFQDLTANRSGGFVASSLRTALIAAAKRSARIVERLLATGAGTDAAPATMSFEGNVGYAEVQAARGL